MTRFTSPGFRAVNAESATEAARVFANRVARKEYGRNGYIRNLRLDCWTRDGRSHTYQAFVGRPVVGDRAATTGRNEWIYVNSA